MSNFKEPWIDKKPGLLSRAFAALKKVENVPVLRSDEVSPKRPNSTTQILPNKLLRGWTVPVVGESFYQESFQRLYSLSSNPDKKGILETATLKIDPTNEHSPSGKAVAVYINGLKVGHIAERICEVVFDGLEKLGGSAQCDCYVYFDTSSGDFRYNSVDLSFVLPPTLESESGGAKLPSLKTGPHIFRLGLFKISQTAGSLLQELTEGEVMLMRMNFSFSGPNVEVTTVDGDVLFNSISIQDPLPFSMPSGGKIYYLDTKAVSLGDGTFEISIFSSSPVKSESTRTGDSISDAGNVLSSRYELGMVPSNRWLKIKYEKSLLKSPGSSSFLPDAKERTKYFWARVSQGPGLWSPLGFRGDLYRADVDKFTWNLNTVPSFWVLVRASLGEGGKDPLFEAAFDSEASLTVFPQRPIVPVKALTSGKPVVTNQKKEIKTPEPKIYTPELAENFSVDILNQMKITPTGFDFLEQSYLVPAMEKLGISFADSVTKSKTGLLVGGSYFELDNSAKAQSSARYGIPIVTIETVRSQLHDLLDQEEIYRALCRYESWLSSIGLNSPHSWGDASAALDFDSIDAVLIPGAALDERNVFSNVSFFGSLVGLAESKSNLAEFFNQLGGQILDSVVIKAEVSYREGNSGLVMELHRNGVFLGRTPANQTESLAESAKLYDLSEVWLKIDWLSQGRFKATFSFFD